MLNNTSWLQDALIDFLREWTAAKVSREQPGAAEVYVSTALHDASPARIIIRWTYAPFPKEAWSIVEGTEWYTPREALALFLEHGLKSE